MRLIGLSCLFLLTSTHVFGQQLFVQKYPKEVYQGSDQNWFVSEDKKGVLYVGNNDGILTFDGDKWDLISLPDKNYAFSMSFDSRERLYTGSNNELGYLQRDELGKYQYHSLIGLLPEAYRAIKNINQVVVFRDTVFFGGQGYIYLYANRKFKLIPSKTGRLLKFQGRVFLLDDEGLHAYKNGAFEPAGFDEEIRDRGIKISRIKDYVGNTCLLLDDMHKLWVLDLDAAPGNRLHLFPDRRDASLKDAPILSMIYLDNGTIALLLEKGLLFIDKEGQPVNFISKEMFGTDIGYARLFQDIHHNLWMSATDSYIFQIVTSSPLSYYDKDNGIQGQIISLGNTDRYRYVGTTKGIFYQEKDKGFSPLLLTAGETWNFYNFHGREYVAHQTGVFGLEGIKSRKLIDQDGVHCLCELRGHPDCLLMGTFNDGLWLMEKKGKDWRKRKIRGFEAGARFVQIDSAGNIWIDDFNYGIAKIRLDEQLDSAISVTFYDERYGLPSKADNRAFQLKNGDLIAATSKGIYGYNREKDRFAPLPEFGKALPEGWNIISVVESEDGDIYFRCESAQYRQMAGFLRRRPGGHFELIQAPFYKMAVPSHGLAVGDDDPLLIINPHEIWISTGEKLVTYDPAKKSFYNDPMTLFIDKVWAKDSMIFDVGQGSEPPPDISWSRNRLRFKFLSTYFESPEKVEYQDSLDGFDNKWSDWSRNKEAIFTNLQEGKYAFWVRARNMYGKISEPVSYSFSIKPPWFRTWWAYLLYLLTGLVLLYALIKINARRINIKNRILEEKVEEKTREVIGQAKVLRELNATKDKLFSIISHDLRGPIGTMKNVVDLMKSQSLSEQDVRSFSIELSEHLLVTGHLLNNLLFWAKTQMEGIRSVPTHLDLQEIAAENCQLFKAPTESKGIRLINTVGAGLEVYADREIVKMVLRNLINNAVKFTGNGGEIIISAAVDRDHVEIAVEDTGIGLSKDEINRIIHKQLFQKPDTQGQLGAGLGLMLCMELIERDGAFIKIESEPGKGSRFSVKIPSRPDVRG